MPPPRLCTDNGVMVAWAGIERLRTGLADAISPLGPESGAHGGCNNQEWLDVRPRWPLTHRCVAETCFVVVAATLQLVCSTDGLLCSWQQMCSHSQSSQCKPPMHTQCLLRMSVLSGKGYTPSGALLYCPGYDPLTGAHKQALRFQPGPYTVSTNQSFLSFCCLHYVWYQNHLSLKHLIQITTLYNDLHGQVRFEKSAREEIGPQEQVVYQPD